jgi:LPXTG-motif cell wall-anchored protein
MKSFQLVMYIVYAVAALGVIGTGIWFWKKKKEDE